MELKGYIEDLLAAEDLRPATVATYDSVMRVHIVPGLGDRQMEEIAPAELRAFFGSLYRHGVGRGATAMVYRLLSKAFRTAMTDELIIRNPLAAIRQPKRSRTRLDPPTSTELELIVVAIQPRYRALTRLLAWTGLRIGEAGGLTVDDWDVERRRLTIRQQSGRYGMAPLKTDAARRIVVVPKSVAADLERHMTVYPPVDGRLFATRTGGRVFNDVFHSAFRTACRKAGVRAFHPHELRHHAVSAMARSGAPIKAVQAVVGHTSAKLTLEVYSHVTEQDLEDVADRLDQVASLIWSSS